VIKKRGLKRSATLFQNDNNTNNNNDIIGSLRLEGTLKSSHVFWNAVAGPPCLC